MLNGGLMPQRPYLVVGPAGTGKTTLALQFLCEGVRQGEEALIVTLEEPPNEMRFNHRALQPELDKVWVFDAIPDVMRYERAPFKDVAQVRDAVPFSQVAPEIRKTPELTSVEITLTALEQTLKMQKARRRYSRVVIDSLTALQYFCMKGIDEVQGAQSFVRFLSSLGMTAVLTVESALEDFESPERMLARGELRLFRWDLEGRTVRAVGVEKFRGSSHDNRLHPYRIGNRGLDIRLDQTISRDTRIVLRPAVQEKLDEHVEPIVVSVASGAIEGVGDPVGEILAGISAEIEELRAARLDLATIRGTLESARLSLVAGEAAPAQAALAETRALVHQMTLGHRSARPAANPGAHRASAPRHLPEQPLPRPELDRMVGHLSNVLAVEPPTVPSPAGVGPLEPPPPPERIEITPPPPLIAEPVVVAPGPPVPTVPVPIPGTEPEPGAAGTSLIPESPGAGPVEPSAPASLEGVSPMSIPRSASGPSATGSSEPETARAQRVLPAELAAAPVGAPQPTTEPAPGGPPTSVAPSPPPPSAGPPAAEAVRSSPATSPSEPTPAEAEHASSVAFGPTFETLEAPRPVEPSSPVEREPPTVPAPAAGAPAIPPSEPGATAAPKRRRKASASTTRKKSVSPAASPAGVSGPDTSPAAELLASISVELPPVPKPRRRSPRRKKSADAAEDAAHPSTEPPVASAETPVADTRVTPAADAPPEGSP